MPRSEIRIFAAIWGKEYESLFLEVNLPSILSDVETLTEVYKIKMNVYCEEEFTKKIVSTIKREFKSALEVSFISFKQLGFHKKALPNEKMGKKYELISSLHRHFFETAPVDTLLIFNYSDFFWSKGTLEYVIKQTLKEGKTAIFSFCPPVKRKFFIQKIQMTIGKNKFRLISEMLNDNLLEFLHPEVFRRDVNQKVFSVMPSYLVSIQNSSGLTLHAYHQTTVALVKIPEIAQVGMIKGTLDGYYTGFLFEFLKKNKKKFSFLCDMNSQLIVSLHPDNYTSNELKKSIFRRWDEPDLFQKMFRSAITLAQIPMSEIIFYWRSPNNKQVREPEQTSTLKIIKDINQCNQSLICFDGIKIKKIDELSTKSGYRFNHIVDFLKRFYHMLYKLLILD